VRKTTRDEAGVVTRFSVPPASIPDYLALVGDTSDGFPGLPSWGPKSAALLAKFGRIDAIPDDLTTLDFGESSDLASKCFRLRSVRWP
jgi:5'-3' exonuclease